MSTNNSADANDLALALDAFVVQHAGMHHRPIAVVTSGGTAVDLEVHAVRCLENFSTGTRGAMAVEGFLQRGYAVIHLWRIGSASPYARFLATEMLGLSQPNHGLNVDCLARLFANDNNAQDDDDEEDYKQEQENLDPWLTGADSARSTAGARAAVPNETARSRSSRNVAQTVALHRNLVHSTRLHKVLRERTNALAENRLLTVPFRTVEEYLTKLQTVARAVNSCHALTLFFLAAAVSDFYIPANERVQHKIQSSDVNNNKNDNDNGDGGDGGLILHLKPVPKTIGTLRTEWAPNAFCVSFKLETDMALLRKKAERAVQKYGCHMVIGNILETRHSTIWILAPPTQQEKNPQYSNATSSSLSPSVQDWSMQEISRPNNDNNNNNNTGRNMDIITNALEDALLDAVVQRHFEFLSWHFHQDDEGGSSSVLLLAMRKTMQDIEKKKQEANQQLFWKRIQKTSLELVGVALSILLSYAVNSILQRRQNRSIG